MMTPAPTDQKKRLKSLAPEAVKDEFGRRADHREAQPAPGKNAPIGGIKVIAPGGSPRDLRGPTIYKIYAESFNDEAHLKQSSARLATW